MLKRATLLRATQVTALVWVGAQAIPGSRSVDPVRTYELGLDLQDLAAWEGRVALLRADASAGDPVVQVLDPGSGRIRLSFGRSGVGPVDLLQATSLQTDAIGRLWLLDLPRRRWVAYKIEEGEPKANTALELGDGTTILDAIWVRDSIYTTGFFDAGAFAVLDSAGAVRAVRGSTGKPRPDSVQIAYHLNRARLSRVGERTIVLARVLQPRLDFYDLSGRLTAVGQAPGAPTGNDVRTVLDTEGRERVVPTAKTRFDYLDVATVGSFVYALYSGRTEATHGSRSGYGSAIHIFTRTGGYYGMVMLAADLRAIAAAPGLLYGVGPGPRAGRSTLHAYRLRDLLRATHSPPASRPD